MYCFSRKDTEDVTRELQLRGIRAGCYHADMDAQHRSEVHHAWAKNDIQASKASWSHNVSTMLVPVKYRNVTNN